MKLKKRYKIELAETLQSHWYSVHKISDVKIGAKYKKAGNSVTTEKFLGYFPSSTTILEAYPLSSFLVDWKVRQGATASDRILKEGHTLDEWNRLNSFVAWYKEYKPKILETEFKVFSEKYGYSGTFDVLCKIDGKIMLGDWKTSSNIYNHFLCQLAS